MKKKQGLSIRNKFFFTMLLSSGLVILILLTATSLIFLNHFIRLETNASQMQLDYISDQLDFFLTSVDNYSKTIITDEIVQDFCHEYKNTGTPINFQDTARMTEEINHIVQSTRYIHSVSVYGLQREFLASTEVLPKDTDITPAGEDTLGTWMATTKYSPTEASRLIKTFSFIRPFFSYSTGEALGYLELAIPESAIASIYGDQVTADNRIFIVDGEGLIQSSADTRLTDTSYEGFGTLLAGVERPYLHVGEHIIFARYVPTLDWYIVNQLRSAVFMNATYAVILLCIGIGVACLLLFVPAAGKMADTITTPLQKLMTHTQTIKAGNWIPYPQEDAVKDEDIGQLFASFNSMITAQEQLKNDLLETQMLKDKISLDLLQQQINPHFLYNTLDNICSLAELDEKETLIEIVMNLSTFYRETLNSGKTFVTVGDELELTRAYLDILRIRYHDKFTFTIDCPMHLYHARCLKLLLQPIVENSIYHGIKEISEKGLITISVREKENGIIFTIKDNGVGITNERIEQMWHNDSNHFGIKNIHQRIVLYYGSGYGLNITNGMDGGCLVTVFIGKTEV